jgi:hypothetical protein
MVKKVILSILCIFMGAVFIFSGYTKLNPIEPFEYTFVDLGVASWRLAPFVARFFISLEFFIGILFILNIKIKAVCKISFITLIVFSLYLLGLMFIGNKGNCGCFGNYLAMTPLQALLKNAVMLAVVALIYKFYEGFSFKRDSIVFYVLLLGSLSIPHILNYVDLDYSEAYLTKKEDAYKMELDTLYKYAEKTTPAPKSLSTGKHIIAFMSATCPHCRIAAKKIKIMADKNHAIPFYLVLNGKADAVKGFFDDTKLTNVPYTNLNGKGFVFLAGLVMPYICLVNNSEVENAVDYIHLDQGEIESWLKK